MRALVLAVNGLILLSWAADLANSQPGDFTTKKPFMKPERAGVAKGDVAFQSHKGNNGEAVASKAQVNSNVNIQGRGDFNAKRDGTGPKVVAKTPKGETAKADQTNKDKGVRTAEFRQRKGELKNSKSGNDQNVGLASNNGPKIDTVMHGNKDSFDAAGSKGHKYNVDPATQSKADGKGVITMDGVKHNYQETRAANGDANAQLTDVGKNHKTFTCQGQKQGISNCVDQNGLKAGEVVGQKDGTVIVKKTVAKGVDVPIGKAKVVKNQNGKSEASVNDGMFAGQAGNSRQRDCMSDYGKPATSKVKIEKPITVKFNSESKDSSGRKTFNFPDCVTAGAKITLPPGVDGNRIAVEYIINLLPAGELKCVDSTSCDKNRHCYFCNFCSNSRKMDVASNFDTRNLCNVKGGTTIQTTATGCPPPEQFNKAGCDGFTKLSTDYWKKQGDLDVKILIWERPLTEEKLKDECYQKIKKENDPTGFVKGALKAQFLVKNKQFINAQEPTDYDLCNFYVLSNAQGKEDLVGCVQGTMNYTVSSQKVNTKWILEAGGLAAAPKQAFDNKKCPQVDAVNQQQAADDTAAADKRNPKKPGFNAGNWGSFFKG